MIRRRASALWRRPEFALLLALLLLPMSVHAGGSVPPGSTFTLEFSFPLPNLCTYQVTSVDVVPPLATPAAFPTSVTGMSGDSFFGTFVAGSATGSGTAQVSLLAESPGCEIAASVAAFYTISDDAPPPPPPPPPPDPPPPPSGPPSMTPDQAARSFRRETRDELRDARNAFRDAVDLFCQDLESLEGALRAGTGALDGDALDAVLGTLNDLFSDLSDAVREAGSDITLAGFAHFLETNGIPFRGILSGDCDTIDRARARLSRDLDRSLRRTLRKFKAFSRRVARDRQRSLVASLAAPTVPPIAPNSAGPAPAPFKKFLQIGATLASDAPGTLGAKQICAAGIADPADGGTVHLKVLLPGSEPEVVLAEGDATVDPVTCRWRLCVASGGSDPLGAGNYLLRASQASGLLAEKAVGVPGTP